MIKKGKKYALPTSNIWFHSLLSFEELLNKEKYQEINKNEIFKNLLSHNEEFSKVICEKTINIIKEKYFKENSLDLLNDLKKIEILNFFDQNTFGHFKLFFKSKLLKDLENISFKKFNSFFKFIFNNNNFNSNNNFIDLNNNNLIDIDEKLINFPPVIDFNLKILGFFFKFKKYENME
jgi:hypothetical protein